MRFESNEDIAREQKAIKTFVSVFSGSYKKLDPNDIDFRVYDSNDNLIAFAEVKARLRKLSEAFPLPVSARKLVKLGDKRLNPVMIWACDDGIIYSRITLLLGEIKWGGRKPQEGSVNDQELMVYFNNNTNFKYVKYPL
tara:strand:- start:13132 stop:13548 length:417 start_codon:yes stop_codon:yes gene_type:complete